VGTERRRPAEALTAQRRRRLAGILLAGALLLAIPGCGAEPGGRTATTASRLPAGGGGILRYDMVAVPSDLDPLQASGREQELVSLQLHEPLVSAVAAPYGRGSAAAGLALSLRPSPDGTIWTASLRSGVRFHDGTPFNASAVLANARRWASLPAARALVPGLYAADAPRPDVVRFLLRRPLPDLPERLSSPQLGIVSPQSLRPQSGVRARVSGTGATGTGPFEMSALGPGSIVLTRYAPWWGSDLNLGPALDGIQFHGNADQGARLADLESGRVDVADALPPASLTRIAGDPLLSVLPGPDRIGLSRAVRGIDSAEPVSFSGVWLTTVGGGAG
jgi:peptide/nickel transport system substrate-binding protein